MCNVGIQALGNKIHGKIVFCIWLKRLYVIGWKASQGCRLFCHCLLFLININVPQKLALDKTKHLLGLIVTVSENMYVALFIFNTHGLSIDIYLSVGVVQSTHFHPRDICIFNKFLSKPTGMLYEHVDCYTQTERQNLLCKGLLFCCFLI